MLNYRLNINKSKNLLNYGECKKLIYQKNFEQIDSGTQSEVYKAYSNKCGSVVIKRAGKKEYDEKYNNYMFKKLILENKILLKIKRLITNDICPNFIEVIDFIPEKKCLVLEYADGNVTKLIKESFTFEILLSLILQMLFAFLCVNRILKIFHNDSNLNNILYKRIDKNIVFCYKINGKKYYVPTFGYLFMLSDFGRTIQISYIEKEKKDIKKYNDLNILYFEIIKNIVIFIANKHNEIYSSYKNIFNLKNQNIIEDLIKEGVIIQKIIKNTKNLKKMSLPIFNTEEMVKNDFTEDFVELLNITDSELKIEILIDKIYNTYLTRNSYDSKKIVFFEINI